MTFGLREIVFLCVALLTTVPCLIVVFSRNVLYSPLRSFHLSGNVGLYFFLDAEFLAITQVVVYIGGVSVLLLFAILLTKNVNEIRKTNTMSVPRLVIAAGAALVLLGSFVYALLGTRWARSKTRTIGHDDQGVGRASPEQVPAALRGGVLLLLAVLVGSLVDRARSVK